MQGILKLIGETDISKSAPEIVEQINELKKSYCEVNDFAEIKNYFNNLLLSFEKDIELQIEKSENPLKSAVKYAMAGIFIDFGAMENVDEEILKEKLYSTENISINTLEFGQFENDIKSSKNIVYLTDNCGEIFLYMCKINRRLYSCLVCWNRRHFFSKSCGCYSKALPKSS